jgi:hypothetical protein
MQNAAIAEPLARYDGSIYLAPAADRVAHLVLCLIVCEVVWKSR